MGIIEEMITKELVQAINDWQRGGDTRMKRKRGARLKELASSVDSRWKTVEGPCYRRMALDKHNLFEIGEKLRLPETIAAWTLDAAVAECLKDGVPEPGAQGVIFQVLPEAANVVLNLSAVYEDERFQVASGALKIQIKGFERGIGRYGNSQREVVLEMDAVSLDSVWAFGGYSSDAKYFAAAIFGRTPSKNDVAQIETWLKEGGIQLGKHWVKNDARERAVEFLTRRARELKPFRRQAPKT